MSKRSKKERGFLERMERIGEGGVQKMIQVYDKNNINKMVKIVDN